MKIYYKEWEQFIPGELSKIWHFFSRPENLDVITPADMKFEILSDISNQEMYEGMIIRYKVTPLLGIKMNWTTEITYIKDKSYFIDEQRFGPYALWHHQHHFIEKDGGVLMQDKLHYAIGFGLFGRMANSLIVSNKIQSIFDYRAEAVNKLFNIDQSSVNHANPVLINS